MPTIQENHHHLHADTQNNPQPPPTPAPPPQPQPHPNPKPNTNSCPRKLLFLFLKWIIMTFILSFFLIFIGFAAFVILHFLLTTTTVNHHRNRRRSETRQSPHNSTEPTSLYSMQDLHKLLPYISYSASSAPTTRGDCAICLEGFKEGELCRKLPDCNHFFHRNCVDNWLIRVPNCPVCRTRVQLDSGASGSRNKSDDDWKFWWPVGA
ncbi:hypothetical protein ACH5RR_006440 [Cinchona calisaya]|uniref:RING-type domain-containing protein n=1 Tax=Cinchona calisaya TaxID=153742 RepID=A0ABD3AP05_9GENT